MAKGRKNCPSCGQEVGCRTLQCSKCNYEFASAKKEAKNVSSQKTTSSPVVRSNEVVAGKTVPTVSIDKGYVRVYTPAGKCPVKLADKTPESVQEWAEDLRRKGRDEKKIYTKEALEYWLQQFINMSDENYDILVSSL